MKKPNPKTTHLAIGLAALLGAANTQAAPQRTYTINSGQTAHQYVMIDSGHSAYFLSLPGNTYTYRGIPPYLPATPTGQQQIIHGLKNAHINNHATVNPSASKPLRKRGWCIPSTLRTTGEEGPAFALDYLTKNGAIHGFVTGTILNCSLVTSP